MSLRSLFSIPEEISYFNVAQMSPLSRDVVIAGQEGLLRKSQPWKFTIKNFYDDVDALKAKFAQLINADSSEIAIVPSATYAFTVAALNLETILSKKQNYEIIVQAEEFPSVYLPLENLAKKTNSKIVSIARPENFDWTSAIIEKINDRTKVIAISPCHWTDGSLADVNLIGTICREKGIFFLVDGCQSVGAREFDVRKARPHFLAVPTYKWMMGPYSFGFLFVDKSFHDTGIPLEENWQVRRGSEDFTNLVKYQPKYKMGAERFDVSERSNPISIPMTTVAVEQLLSWGSEKIQSHTEPIIDEICELAKKKNLRVPGKKNRSRHLIGIEFQNGVPENLSNELISKNVFVSSRGKFLRIAPHIYNDKNDLCRLLEILSRWSQ